MKIYLSGPMTGLPDFNRPEFNRVAAILRAQGHCVFNPAEGDYEPRKSFAEYCNWICLEADMIILLSGWQKSKGAMVELKLAEYIGVNVGEFYER